MIDKGMMPHNLGLDDKYSIWCKGIGGLSLRRRIQLHSQDSFLAGRDLVIIDIGSNDISIPHLSVNQFAINLTSFAAYLIQGLDVKKVAVCQIIRRDAEPFSGYNDRVIDANIAIEAAIKTTGLPIVLWKHRCGLWNPSGDIFESDGIHLSKSVGYPKYLRSIRDCIIRVSAWKLDPTYVCC
ncbi:uncharacterized protein LOC123531060 [Mercenaria mercenaria]|uniref:uncharacterized protein LOC123531060 n=1 Tax=Mercenaria mercenaria TaxID=6596 RepID=UPI001E1D8C2F|nr:uncharacterized protein LOC123531060 [Mercenaria mercenaria]